MITFSSIGKYGRFCNGAFQLASLIGIARKSNQKWMVPLWINHDHKDRFGSSEECDIYKHLVHELPLLPTGLHFQPRFIHWGYHPTFLPNGNWDLSGHMQSEKYFEHCIDEVRYWLTFKNEPAVNNYTAIHVRLGDYDNNYHPVQTMAYYLLAMHEMGNQKFLVFSDEIDKAKEMFGDKVEYSEGRDYIEDFKLMKSCKNFITGNSSYSLMASILANQPGKKVICPSKWFGAVANLSTNDIYPKNAIII